jgi:hypothetical protein
MNQQVIELSCYNSRQRTTNGEWITNLRKPFTLEPNSQVTILQSIIDMNLAGDYNNICISEDVPITIEFGYYYVNDAVDLDYGLTVDTAEKFQFYIARDDNNKLITNKLSFTIKAGNYDAATIAQIISSSVSKIPAYESVDTYASLGGQIIEPMINYYEIGCESFRSTDFGFNSVTAASPFTDSQIEYYTPGTDIYVYWRDNDSSIQKTENSIASLDIPTRTINFNDDIPFLEDSNRITDVYVILKTPIPIKFYNQTGKVPDDWISAKSISRFMGTNEFACEYNINNNGKFQFTQFHMSGYPSNTDNEQSINVMQYNGSGSLFFQDTRTGLFFTSLEPQTFWFDTLGFSRNIIVTDDETNLKLQTQLVRGVNVTSDYVGADALIGSTRTNGAIPISPYSYKTNLTNAIVADSTYVSQDSGYCLIEISAIPTDYNSEIKGLSSGILQIVSNAYDNNGFVTAYGDSSLSFINNSSNAIQYGSFKVRILNPRDYNVVRTLGPRSTIFLTLTQGL